MVPYAKNPPELWPYQQIEKLNREEMALIYRPAAVAYRDAGYEQIVTSLPRTDHEVLQLLHPLPSPDIFAPQSPP